jgi:hypothetical protein
MNDGYPEIPSLRGRNSSSANLLSRPGIEPRPPEREASTLEKSHLDSLFAGYLELLLELRLAQRVASTVETFLIAGYSELLL